MSVMEGWMFRWTLKRLKPLNELLKHTTSFPSLSWGAGTWVRKLLPLLLAFLPSRALPRTSGDAYVIRKGDTWTLGTAKVERTLTVDQGRFLTRNLKNKLNGRELLSQGGVSDELLAVVDGHEISGASGGWELTKATDRTLAQGEIELDLTLRRDSLEVTKTYVVYPGSSIVREWIKFRSVGSVPLKVSEPRFLTLGPRLGAPQSLDFYWMTGGEDRVGCWSLKTEKLEPGNKREFDSYDPFGGTQEGNFIGDGVLVKVLLNGRQVWPDKAVLRKEWECIACDWKYVTNASVNVQLSASVKVQRGDQLAFVLNRYLTSAEDTMTFDPTITYADGETHTASKEFTSEQGENGWRYREVPSVLLNWGGEYRDLVYSDRAKEWREPENKNVDGLFIRAAEMRPGKGQDAVRVWVAPKAGKVRLTGSLVNIGSRPVPGGGRSFRMGSMSYAPWNALIDRTSGNGLFIGWDYFGHWASTFTLKPGGAVEVQFRVAGHEQTLAPGESFTTPKAFVGLFTKDLDNAGNESLDWQYRYLWDYTRTGWFSAIRMTGWWYKGTGWAYPGNSEPSGGTNSVTGPAAADGASAFRKIFRTADLMTEVGGDVYHRDWGWWDRQGDWGGPDFKTAGAYLRKHDMGQLIYAPIYHVEAQSKVALEHSDWVVKILHDLGGNSTVRLTLDMSNPEVVKYLEWQLDDLVERFGQFEWRNDGKPTVPHDGDTPLLGQDQGFREILQHFLDKHPDCAFQAVNDGGGDAGYDYTRYASSTSFSDGAVRILRNHWAALILPPDKSSDLPDFWTADHFDKATWRGLLSINFDIAGDTWEPSNLEGVRELIDIYHYLESQGVVGRWVHVYRPLVAGDDPTMYFQRLSRDGKRGIIIPKRPAPGPVEIKPKGLNGTQSYLVSYQESKQSERRSGADLMENGIKLRRMAPGELIYLNLSYHPGNKLDTTPPTPPNDVRKSVATNMGYPGVEMTWNLGTDDHWISYYEVLRDGSVIDKVAKGAYYFDHSAAADVAADYTVRTVDGAGLRSAPAKANGLGGRRAVVLDDAPGGGIIFTGNWDRQTNLQPAYAGTITRSDAKGASFNFEFEGTKFTWFSKLGDDCGKAEILVDGQRDAVVDTYSADDIWGVEVYAKTFPVVGRHTVKVMVLGEHGGPRGKGTFVYVDGVRAE